ncbi:MAG: hypothetical protein ABI460_13020 [Caldimonas sp.]
MIPKTISHRLQRTGLSFSAPRRVLRIAFAIGLCAAGATATPARAHQHGREPGSSPLVEKVRLATARFVNINNAMNDGWIQATPCVSGPSDGAMGVHFLKPDRLHDGVLKGDEPEMLIYEPVANGKFRLVGVEYIVLANEWSAKNEPGAAPSVDGHLANFVAEPNRYALPAFYELHVWAWADNPNGSFADWNSKVSCDRQRVSR